MKIYAVLEVSSHLLLILDFGKKQNHMSAYSITSYSLWVSAFTFFQHV